MVADTFGSCCTNLLSWSTYSNCTSSSSRCWEERVLTSDSRNGPDHVLSCALMSEVQPSLSQPPWKGRKTQQYKRKLVFVSCSRNNEQWNDHNFGCYKLRGYLEPFQCTDWTKQHETNEKCIMRNFTSCRSSPNVSDSIKDDNIGTACGMCIGGEKHMQRFCRETWKKEPTGRHKHRWENAMKMDQAKVWTVLLWLRTRKSGSVLWTR